MSDTRERIARDNLKTCLDNFSMLDDWNKQFVNSIRTKKPKYLSDKQFSKLQDAASGILIEKKKQELGIE